MKKLASILALVLAFTVSTQAQKGKTDKRARLTTEQQTELTVKKMTLALDLSRKQQSQIKPLISNQIAERKANMEKRKEARKDKKRPTSDEIFAMQNKRLDAQIAMRNSMKDILNDEQFEKFEKMYKKRAMKGRKMAKRKGMKNRKEGRRVRR
ncbi:hypothetical protein [uncultured Polaribacter sp.]|uniref:hypothetical protein n=1 Tax=uncultured Polaribacter sp. TaxID=174711 RepID=UPI00261470AF|nr:hypothetical protein [uncultured Polaribacter sp.]